jgi:hypothetical protein
LDGTFERFAAGDDKGGHKVRIMNNES